MHLEVRTLSERIFSVIRDRIVSGKIPSNLAIRQDALASEFGCSKIPLREALARLEQEGLLISQANRGFFVRPLSAQEAEDIYALRIRIEPDAVRDAAGKADDEDRAAARAALDEAIERRGDDVGRLHRAFHLALVHPAAKRISARMVERLHILSERYIGKHLEPSGREGRAIEEHESILAAWAAGDGARAAKLTHRHIALTLEDLRRQFAADNIEADRALGGAKGDHTDRPREPFDISANREQA